MIDTLTVITNSLPDTLRIVLSNSDKPDFWNQYSPLLVAVLVVVLSSSINLYIAAKRRRIDEKKIKETKKLEEKKIYATKEIEEKKIKSDLILKEKQKWVSEFRTILFELLMFIDSFEYDKHDNLILDLNIINKIYRYNIKLKLYTNNENVKHELFTSEIMTIIHAKSEERTKHFVDSWFARIATLGQHIIYEGLNEINKV